MFERIRKLFSEPHIYEASLESSNFIESVTLEKTPSNEVSHSLRIEFKQPVRDGNELVQLNIRDEYGTVVREWQLRIGETQVRIPIDPFDTYFDCVGVKDDGTVDSVDRINIYEL